MSNSNTIRSHRPGETTENYLYRLAHARLRPSEQRELETLYARLDSERLAAGLPSAERVPWTRVDILEWRDLKTHERYLDLKTYAHASDRITGIHTLPVAA